MQRVVNVGIIGCGGIAFGKHLPSLYKLNNVRLVAFCDIIEERAKKAAEKYGADNAKVYLDYKELLKDTEIDVVHVLTPNKSHADITVDALYAGKNVMCEKPMAKSADDAKRMLDAAQKTGKKLTIGYQHRYKAESEYAKALIEEGALGNIYHAKCYAIRRRGTPNWGVFLNKEEQGGGPLIDIATHSLDLTLYLMNNYEPEMVVGKTHKEIEHPEDGNAWGDKGVSTTELEEAACGLIVMKNGATILLDTSWALNTLEVISEGSCLLCGTKGGLQIINDKLTVNFVKHGRMIREEVDTKAGGVAFYDGNEKTPQSVEAEKWINAVVNDKELVVKPEQAYVVSQILDAIYKSNQTGKPVYFK